MTGVGYCGVIVVVLCFTVDMALSQGRLRSYDIDFAEPCEIVRSNGYVCEVHKVVTPDGYILTVHRIPYGRNSSSPGPPTLLMHGILSSSASWLLGGPEKAFGYLLADEGYDVWMANTRGNMYSMEHVNLTATRDRLYWGFSLDETGGVDVPAIMDYVLNATGHEKLYCIGHSMGGTNLFISLIRNPEYNAKVRLLVGLGPATNIKNTRSLFRVLLNNSQLLVLIHESMGWYQFMGYDRKAAMLLSNSCCNELLPLTKAIIFALSGTNEDLLDVDTLPAMIAQHPAGVSMYVANHFAQIYHSGEFKAYDYPTEAINLQRHGQPRPPLYDLNNITAPTVVFYGDGDVLVTTQDLQRSTVLLPNLVDMVRVNYPSFTHLDLTSGKNASSLVLQPVISYMRQF